MTIAERIYAVVTMLLGATVFGYIVSAVGSVVDRVNANEVSRSDAIDEVRACGGFVRMCTRAHVLVRFLLCACECGLV